MQKFISARRCHYGCLAAWNHNFNHNMDNMKRAKRSWQLCGGWSLARHRPRREFCLIWPLPGEAALQQSTMNTCRPILRLFSRISIQDGSSIACRSRIPQSSLLAHPIQYLRYAPQRRFAHNPADNPNFESILDKPVKLVQAGKKHGPGLIILGIYP